MVSIELHECNVVVDICMVAVMRVTGKDAIVHELLYTLGRASQDVINVKNIKISALPLTY